MRKMEMIFDGNWIPFGELEIGAYFIIIRERTRPCIYQKISNLKLMSESGEMFNTLGYDNEEEEDITYYSYFDPKDNDELVCEVYPIETNEYRTCFSTVLK